MKLSASCGWREGETAAEVIEEATCLIRCHDLEQDLEEEMK